jgi:putative cell wall-binding protein
MTTTGNMQRVAGDDRYDTAAKMAAYYPKGLEVVYVSTGKDYPDALAGSARAGYNDGPMVLTRTDSLPAPTLEVLQSLDPERIVVIGGNAAVSAKVLNQLAGL